MFDEVEREILHIRQTQLARYAFGIKAMMKERQGERYRAMENQEGGNEWREGKETRMQSLKSGKGQR